VLHFDTEERNERVPIRKGQPARAEHANVDDHSLSRDALAFRKCDYDVQHLAEVDQRQVDR